MLQCDGNLVIYSQKLDSVFWASSVFTLYGASMILQDDGNLVIRNNSDSIIWETFTSLSCSVGSSKHYRITLTKLIIEGGEK